MPEGSGPREPGAWMAVTADAVVNTIGGGHLGLKRSPPRGAAAHR